MNDGMTHKNEAIGAFEAGLMDLQVPPISSEARAEMGSLLIAAAQTRSNTLEAAKSSSKLRPWIGPFVVVLLVSAAWLSLKPAFKAVFDAQAFGTKTVQDGSEAQGGNERGSDGGAGDGSESFTPLQLASESTEPATAIPADSGLATSTPDVESDEPPALSAAEVLDLIARSLTPTAGPIRTARATASASASASPDLRVTPTPTRPSREQSRSDKPPAGPSNPTVTISIATATFTPSPTLTLTPIPTASDTPTASSTPTASPTLTPLATASEEPPETAVIEGYIVDGEDRELRGARVSAIPAEGGEDIHAESRFDGSFRIEIRADRPYLIRAALDGYRTRWYDGAESREDAERIELPPGGAVEIEIILPSEVLAANKSE